MPDGKQKMTFAEFCSRGGKARAAKLTSKQRSAIARKAAKKRWANKKRKANNDSQDSAGKEDS